MDSIRQSAAATRYGRKATSVQVQTPTNNNKNTPERAVQFQFEIGGITRGRHTTRRVARAAGIRRRSLVNLERLFTIETIPLRFTLDLSKYD